MNGPASEGRAAIRADERVSAVIARDEKLIEVFAQVSPNFERLRNPAVRHTMARLVTVEQAARIAGVEPGALVASLNHALGVEAHDAAAAAGQPPSSEPAASDSPTPFAALPPERIADLDVRDDLRNGREPFQRIMEAARDLPPDQVLRLRAIFEPAPLYNVLGRQGFAHFTERLADDDWRVWFYREASAELVRLFTPNPQGEKSHGRS